MVKNHKQKTIAFLSSCLLISNFVTRI